MATRAWSNLIGTLTFQPMPYYFKMATCSDDKKEINVIVVGMGRYSDCISTSFVSEHILKEKIFLRYSPSSEATTRSMEYDEGDVVHKTRTYNIKIYRNIDQDFGELKEDVRRYFKDVHCIVFVVDEKERHREYDKESEGTLWIYGVEEDEEPHLNIISKIFSLETQSVSLLVITGYDSKTNDETKEDLVEKYREMCGSYQMKKGIIPVCFAVDDFDLPPGPLKRIRERKIKEDEDQVLSLIRDQCDEMVPVEKL